MITTSRCIICGRPIVGAYYEDWAGQRICASHGQDAIHICHSCGCLCGGKAAHLGHDVWLCEGCDTNRITQQTANGVARYILNGYKKAGLGEIKDWTLKVAKLETLVSHMGSPGIKGYAQRMGSQYTVFVLRDLSKTFFADVLAHEMLHIWQFRRNLAPPQDLCEGFCNLGSYFVLDHIARHTGSREARNGCKRLMEDKDPIYGDGFRRIKQHFDHGGWHEAINVLQQANTR